MKILLNILFICFALISNAQTVSITSSATGAICAGTSVTFTATPSGYTTPTYQWYKNNVAIAGAINSTYSSLSLSNNDLIKVAVVEGSASVTTNGLVMNLDAGNSSSYSGTGNTWTDLTARGNNGAITSGITYNSANGGFFQFPNGSVGGIILPDSSSDFNFATGDFAVELWVNAYNNQARLISLNTKSDVTSTALTIFPVADTPLSIYAGSLSTTGFTWSIWHHIVYTRISSIVSLYVDGVLKSTATDASNLPSNGVTTSNTLGSFVATSSYLSYSGKMSIARVYKAAGLTSSQVKSNYNAICSRYGLSAIGSTSNTITTTVNPGPTIPLVNVVGDGCINKTILSAPSGLFSYAWYKDNVAIFGATSNTYIPTTAGAYKVEVSNGTCTNMSSVTTISICGLTADGSMILLETSTTLISKEGAKNNGKGIDESGKILSKPWVYGTVTTRTGRIWMDRNLGASRVALSPTDSQAYGDYYQWGRPTDGHEKHIVSGTANDYSTVRSTTTVPVNNKYIFPSDGSWDWLVTPNNTLWTGVNAPNNPCPSGFRIPTESEWAAEAATFTSNNVAGSFEAGYGLKLTVAGMAGSPNNITAIGNYGQYLTQTAYDSGRVKYFGVISFTTWFDTNYYKITGQSCRCIKD